MNRATYELPNASAAVAGRAGVLTKQVHAALLLVATVVLAGVILRAAVPTVVQDNQVAIYTMGLNIVLCALGLCWSAANDAFSMRVLFWYYNFLFLALVPLAQYLTDGWYYPIDADTVIKGNLVVLLSLASFAGMSALGRRRSKHYALTREAQPRPINGARLLAFGLLALVAILVVIARFGFSASHSLVLAIFGDVYTPQSMIAEFLIRPLVFFGFLFAICRFKWERRTVGAFVTVLITAAAAFLVLGPFSASRFFIFAMYLGLFALVYPPYPERRYVYFALLVGGLVGSQMQNALRGIIAGGTDHLELFSSSYFYQGHFDGFENLCHGIDFVARKGVAWGSQFVGAILFWVPREWWPNKPVGTANLVTAQFLSQFFNVGNLNVAAPLVQEAYVNFKLPGVAIIFSALGYVSGVADGRYRAWLVFKRTAGLRGAGRGSGYMVYYPVITGLMLFILRGDLLSSFAFTSGITVAFILMRMFACTRPRAAEARQLEAGSW